MTDEDQSMFAVWERLHAAWADFVAELWKLVARWFPND